MPAIKLRALSIENFLCFAKKTNFQWVEEPKSYKEKTPMKIGFCGINGTGKSTALSRALPWIMHPISNSLDEEDSRGFNDDSQSIKASIIFEWNTKIYEARRIKYTDGELEQSLHLINEDGSVVSKIGEWKTIFGEDGDSASFLPYLWENSQLHKAAASMGSVGGLHYFSSNLGTSALLHDIYFIIEDFRTKKVTVE